ncbi:uncharacterized protein [Glycine max]|uniref:uncharacterized protein n=1 Tax=Glycine max TaxID=3847 RepID=UPI00071943AC|nr:uncharacterized protein LOC106798745 [Glycine max]|eukprot:XP_014631276.1 uncharacterized protein LOC106798745 [Glycine max]
MLRTHTTKSGTIPTSVADSAAASAISGATTADSATASAADSATASATSTVASAAQANTTTPCTQAEPRRTLTSSIFHAGSSPCRPQQAPSDPRVVLHLQPAWPHPCRGFPQQHLTYCCSLWSEAALHDKLLEHRDMALLEKSIAPYGPTLAARERQPAAFALGTVADPKDPHRYRPWDLGGPRQTGNTLRTRCF